eukprot:gene19238-25089_t
MFDILKKFDAFPKAIEDFRIRTASGATISIFSIILMVLLFLSELNYYYRIETIDHFYVNTTRTENLKVDFDLSFPLISCSLLSLDVLDDTGAQQTDAVHNIFKYKLDTKTGNVVGDPTRFNIGNTFLNEHDLKEFAENQYDQPVALTKKSSCGNCYGSREPGICCNTCDDVKEGYRRMGWRFKEQGILQCEEEAASRSIIEQNSEEGGCRIFGELELNQSSGHFHIAPQKSINFDAKDMGPLVFLLSLMSLTFDQFNVTHTINSLSFGDQFPGFTSPLDGQSRTLQDIHGMYQYYLKVVPTKYQHLDGKIVESNQYAVTEHMRHLDPGSGRGLPGVYFYYEVSPIQAVFEERRIGNIWRFLTSVCAIVGGSFTVFQGKCDDLFRINAHDHGD